MNRLPPTKTKVTCRRGKVPEINLFSDEELKGSLLQWIEVSQFSFFTLIAYCFGVWHR